MSYKKQKTSHLQLKQQAPHKQHQEQQQQHQQQQQQQQQQAAQGFKSLGLQLHPDSSLITYVYIKRQKAQDGDAASTAHALYVTGLPLGVDEAALQAIFELFGDVEDVVMHPSKVRPCRWPGINALQASLAGLQLTTADGSTAPRCHADHRIRPHICTLHQLEPHTTTNPTTNLFHFSCCRVSPQRSAAVVFDAVDGVSAAMKQGGSGQVVQYELPPPEGPVGLKAWVADHKTARPGNEALQQQVCRCEVFRWRGGMLGQLWVRKQSWLWRNQDFTSAP
jgi:hypothetical protein